MGVLSNGGKGTVCAFFFLLRCSLLKKKSIGNPLVGVAYGLCAVVLALVLVMLLPAGRGLRLVPV